MSDTPTMPPLAEFAAGLFSAGQAAVRRGADLSTDTSHALELLAEAFAAARYDLVEVTPPSELVPHAALEGLRYLYQVCLALNDRALDDAEVSAICSTMPPAPATPDEVLSLDLTLRHLPTVQRRARALSQDDVLVHGLTWAAARFPLSSVGIAIDPPPDLSLVRRHAGLWQLYIDRVTERQDSSRLRDPSVAEAVRDVLGLHPALAPTLAAQLAVASV